jgi:hypothetical protein
VGSDEAAAKDENLAALVRRQNKMNVKQKGNRFEQLVARRLRELFPNVRTSREMNKWLDGQGVDLVETYLFKL